MRSIFTRVSVLGLAVLLAAALPAAAQTIPAPDRSQGEGEGPFQRLIIRGGMVIDGTGAPPAGPTDIVIEGNRIVSVQTVGYPGVAINEGVVPEARTTRSTPTACTCFPGSSTTTSTPAAPPRTRSFPTPTSSGWPTASRRCAAWG
jgi:hypothetical protein